MNKKIAKRIRKSGGGVATHSGTNYQNRVAAWFCVRILSEQEATPPWQLSEDVALESLSCETEEPVDDILVNTSEGGRAFVQVKHTLTLEASASSALGSTIDQFVRQVSVAPSQVKKDGRPGGSLDPKRDRLVLITSPRSSLPIRRHLPAVLSCIRQGSAVHTLDNAAANAEQRTALRLIRGHVESSWRELTGVLPEPENVRDILSLVWIQTLDVDEGGGDEQTAKDSLRTSVLEDTSQSSAAWGHLIEACARYASSQTGADRNTLRQELVSVGIRVKTSRSFRGDIERLQLHSASTLKALKNYSRILVGTNEVKIERPSTSALRSAAEEESLLVVGEPGAGKSGALYDVVDVLRNEGRDYIFLAVDRLEARNLGPLRDELRLTHDIIDVLEHWAGERPAFLVVDAFDAARSESSARTIYELVAEVKSRAPHWHLIVSIRKFDLRYNEKLRRLFGGVPPAEFFDHEFGSARHLNVPRLSDEEWLQVPPQSPELATLYIHAAENLKALLHNPFNLRLAGELLGEGISVESLSPIETQIGLLDRYWNHRVVGDNGNDDARESVLRRAAEAMVRARSLRVNRYEVVGDTPVGEPLREVLSSHILSEWQEATNEPVERSVLTFAHHMLFDYSVARLMLRGVPATLISRLEREPDLVMAIRPSIVMHFQHERMRSDEGFWDAVFRVIRSPQIPEIGKLIGPSVAVELMRGIQSFAPLARGLSSDDHSIRDASEKALRHLAGALMVSHITLGHALVGDAAPPWAELFDYLAGHMRATTAYALRPVLLAMCEHPERMSAEQASYAGRIARRLLEFALAQEKQRDVWLVISGFQAVCRTFTSDAAESARLLRRLLEPSHVATYGHEELFRLGNELEYLIPVDPELVEEMYHVTFTVRDYSDERTLMVGSRIVPLASTRRQDYDMARYVFAGKFKDFIEASPIHATRALIATVEAYGEERYTSGFRRAQDKDPEETFDLNGRQARIRTDYSDIWATSGSSSHDKQVQMLDVFQDYLKRISDDADRADERLQLINLIVEENCTAVFWRKLLACGATAPQTLGYELRSLGWARPILFGFDTTQPAGEFLSQVFGLLSPEERGRVERTILSIPGEIDASQREAAIHARNRLLGCLPFNHLTTSEAKRIIEELQSEHCVPANEARPPVQVMTLPYTDREFLAGQGVPVEEEQNRRIQTLSASAKDFAARYLNGTPTREEVKELLPGLRALYEALKTAEADGVHESQQDLAWGYLADSAEAASRCKELSCETDEGTFLKSVLLEASEYPQPIHSPAHDEAFDRFPSWGSPSARIDAAKGVVNLMRHASCADNTLLQTIQRLGRDAVPAVRYMVASNILSLYDTAPERMWDLIEYFSRTEPSRGVLQGLVGVPLNRLAGRDGERVVRLTQLIFERTRNGEGATEVQKLCASIFLGLYLWQDNSTARGIIVNLTEDPEDYADAIHQMLHDSRSLLNIGPVHPSDPHKNSVRQRAFEFIERTVRQTRDKIRGLEEKYKGEGFDSWPKAEQEQAQRLARIAESICMEIYFASGAYRDNQDETKIPRGAEERLRYLRESQRILDTLCEFGYASLTHHLMQTLEYLISYEPAHVFLMAGRVVRSGKKDFYQHESLAVDLVVSLVERVIAEFRYILQDNEECRKTLIEILDTFVDAGWPSARRLAYRLEEIYR